MKQTTNNQNMKRKTKSTLNTQHTEMKDGS